MAEINGNFAELNPEDAEECFLVDRGLHICWAGNTPSQ